MDSFAWLTPCTDALKAAGTACVDTWQIAYLVLLLALVVVLFIAARRSRDMTTSVLALMPVGIALNIAVGSIVSLLKLPIYLDSIGTVLVGVLGGPWAGALTGLLANLIWALLPIPGGAGPVIAFFAPVALVIGLMAGFWGARGVFQMRADDPRVGSFLAMFTGIVAGALAFFIVQQTIGMPDLNIDVGDPPDPALQQQLLTNQALFVTYGIAFVVIGVVVAWLARRTVFRFKEEDDQRIRRYLSIATAVAAFTFTAIIVRLLFGTDGWFSIINGTDGAPFAPLNLSGLALADPYIYYVSFGAGLVAAFATGVWANTGNNARLFPVWVGGLTTGLVAAAMSAPIAAFVFGGVTGSGQDLLVSLYRTLGLSVFQSAFAQGLTSDPLDKTISYTVVYFILAAMPISVRTIFSRGETTVAEV